MVCIPRISRYVPTSKTVGTPLLILSCRATQNAGGSGYDDDNTVEKWQ